MRLAKNEFGISVMISNEEYLLLKKIKARGKIKALDTKEYYQEMADKLVSRGLLNKEDIDNEEYYMPLKRSSND